MDAVLIVAGSIVVVAVAQDVFATVLFPASRHGLVRKPVSRWVWHGFRWLSHRLRGQRRRNVLSYGGPAVITVTIVVWFVLLVAGWAMIYKPGLGGSITAGSGMTDTSWATALYFSGFSLTTLGVGDVAASGGGYRLLSVLEAGVGFAVMSMVITYFLGVYSSLTARSSFAQGLHQRSANTGDAAELVAGLADGGDLPDARDHLSDEAAFLRQIYQTHRFYPVLRYFHYRESFYALPRILLLALDGGTLMRTALDEERYGRVTRSRSLDELGDSATSLLDELAPDRDDTPPGPELTAAWRSHYRRAAHRLVDAGLAVRENTDAGADEYVSLRTSWDAALRALTRSMAYEWSDIEPMTGTGRAPTDVTRAVRPGEAGAPPGT